MDIPTISKTSGIIIDIIISLLLYLNLSLRFNYFNKIDSLKKCKNFLLISFN